MFGSTPTSLTKPYGWGSNLVTSTYGQTIPSIIGMTKSTPIQIWNGFLIQAPNTGPGLSGGGEQDYQKAVDFLLGSNPVFGVLRLWESGGARVGLNFVKYSKAVGEFGATTVVVPDPHLYWVVGVTYTQAYSGINFNDYGAPGPVGPLSGTWEIPLWNIAYAGSNPSNMGAYRFWPWIYNWTPDLGSTVQIPVNQYGPPWTGGTINVYYAQLLSTVNPAYTPPLVQVRLFLETQLGTGPEYSGAYASELNPMPENCGMGSTDFFLGADFSSAPQIFPECVGAHSVWSTGDADPVDMIEDTFRAGPSQAGTTIGQTSAAVKVGYSRTQRGLNAYNYPALIQKVVQTSTFPDANSLIYPLANTAGNYLITIAVGNGNMPVDDAGNAWTLAYNWPAGGTAVWKCKAKAWQPGNRVRASGAGPGYSSLFLLEVGGADTLDVIATNFGTASNPFDRESTVSALTTGQGGLPELLVGILGAGVATAILDPGWTMEIDPTRGTNFVVASRVVKFPDTYTFHTKWTANQAAWFSGLLAFSNSGLPPYTSPFGDILDQPSWDLCRAQGRAYGLKGSVTMDSQQSGSDWLAIFAQAGNLDFCWSGFRLKGVPKAEASAVGNGSVYVSPYAAGPIYPITVDDLIGDASTPPVTFEGAGPVNVPNLMQVEFVDRSSDYAETVASEPFTATMALLGVRKDSPIVLRCIQDSTVATSILRVLVQHRNLIEINAPIKFKGQAKLGMIEPGDLVSITEPALGVYQLPLKITSVQEDDAYNLDFEAEPFVYGAHVPVPLTVTAAAPNVNDPNAAASSINPPIIFEAVPQLGLISGQGALWLVVSSSGTNYGGSAVFVSTDGGASYNPVGTINGNAITGYTVGDWPMSADPDTVNSLAVDLTESNGVLSSYAPSDRDNFAYPCYVEPGATGICVVKYELMAYATATLTATSKYTLPPTLRRAVFGAPVPGTGVDHLSGSRFAFLSNPMDTAPAGILKLPINPAWYHDTLYFKFVPFNTLHGGSPSITAATPYAFTPCEPVPIGPPPPVLPGATIVEVPFTAPAQPPSTFSVPHNLGVTPGLVLIEMTSDGEVWLQPAIADATNIYLSASAPGITGIAICFLAPSGNISVPFPTSTNGSLVIPHGLGVKPKLVMPQMTSDGELWVTSYDATNIYATGSAAGITGNFIIWTSAWPVETIEIPPTTLDSSTTITEIPLAPSASGNFTVPHGLGFSPILALIRMTSDGEIWYQSVRYDTTNLYLTASAPGVTAVAEIWS